MNTYQDIRAALIGKRDALDAAIAGLTALIGDEPTISTSTSASYSMPRPKPKAAKKAAKRTNERTKQGPRQARTAEPP